MNLQTPWQTPQQTPWPTWKTMAALIGAEALGVAAIFAVAIAMGNGTAAAQEPGPGGKPGTDLSSTELQRRQALCPRADASLAALMNAPDAGGLVQVGIMTVEYLQCSDMPKTCGGVERALRYSIENRKPSYESVAIASLVEKLPCGREWMLEILESQARGQARR